ncbi:SRF-type transcription factor protein [Rutstroemia sp. NJR-2017a BBW]|nr:SRF-type transcription factor protein [Rutstroemia sp. NJR-2017a BBW]
MGRRKIEIKAIKDDRNRSVYQYYGGANEHKGPGDFTGKGKGGDDDDDDDDDGSPPSHHGSVEPQMMPPQFSHQQAFQHIRHHTPSASPPIPNGVFPHHPQQQMQFDDRAQILYPNILTVLNLQMATSTRSHPIHHLTTRK